jgi:AraC family transcriptional regulator
MNAALDYIEENLAGDIDMAIAAGKACCSAYHFTRMFSFITDVPLSEYIRRRRLTLAGFELKNSQSRIIDLANKYGYDSPNSFTRAFQAMHGVTPTNARVPGVALKSFARISFIISIKGSIGMDYRIVEEGEHIVFGKSLTTNSAEAYEAIPAFWDHCESDRTTNRIVAAGQGNEKTLLWSVMFDLDGDGTMKYMICMDKPEGSIPDEFETVTVPARTWAVFPLLTEKTGAESIISIWKRIYPEWFPNSGYEQDTGPRQERYYWSDGGKWIVEAWVPIVKSRETVL